LSGFNNLSSLDLSYNRLKEINLSGVHSLQYLALNNNNLSTIPEYFTGLNLWNGYGLNIYYNYINYNNFSTELLAFIDAKNTNQGYNWRTTQIIIEPYNCGDDTCESAGYCALANTGIICSNLTPGEACSNGCITET